MTVPPEWGFNEIRLYEEVAEQVGEQAYGDRFGQALYDSALFNWDVGRGDRAIILDALRDHYRAVYGVDFDHVFDWEGYRAAYDSSQG